MDKPSFEGPIAVIGAGTMGQGIAELAAAAGCPVHLFDTRQDAAEAAIAAIDDNLKRALAKGRISAQNRSETLARINPVVALAGIDGSSLAIEAVVEDLEIKRALFAELEEVLASDAILATNTSSLAPDAIGDGLAHPERVIGMHFFNPAPRLPLVEVVRSKVTDPGVVERVVAIARAWNKVPVVCAVTPGFIVNRVARPYYAEALDMLEAGLADAATIDALLQEAGGFPMGAFKLMDMIGLDINLSVTETVRAGFGDHPRFPLSTTQRRLVENGNLGRKTGRGFHCYADGMAREPAALTEKSVPRHIAVAGELGPLVPLARRIEAAGHTLKHRKGPGLIDLGATKLALTDGRTAVERREEAGGPLALVDLALDYAKTRRLALAGDPPAVAAAAGLLRSIGIVATPIADRAGMVVMRTLAALVNEAAFALAEKVADGSAIDTAMRLGMAYPVGPLAWAQKIGSKRVARVLTRLAQDEPERYALAPPLTQSATKATAAAEPPARPAAIAAEKSAAPVPSLAPESAAG